MEQAIEAELRAAWERLSRRNRWTLVDDLEAFLREAAQIYATLDARMSPVERAETAVTIAYHRRAEVAVLQTYGRLLYSRLMVRDERAVIELRTYFYWHSLEKGWQYHDAEDIANEATIRALTKLSTLRSPESIFLWRVRVFQSAQEQLMKQGRAEVPLPTDEEGEQRDLPDPESPIAQVEDQIALAAFIQLIEAAVPNPMDREILMRSFVEGEKPREIAPAMGLNVGYVKVRKCRALQTLMKDGRFVHLLRELSGGSGQAPGEGGSDDR